MSTNVMMPQMGESIAEGTIVRWIKKVGEPIDKDEPLFEISTDKVDAEIPSPGAGVLLEIKVKEGETVPVNSVVAVIGGAGEKVAAAAPAASAPPSQALSAPDGSAAPPSQALSAPDGSAAPPPQASSAPDGSAAPPPNSGPAEPMVAARPAPTGPETLADLRRQRSSPLVRRIAKEHGIDIKELNGSGISGRVTKKDILSYVESGAPRAAKSPQPPAKPFETPPAFKPGEDVRIEKMSVMRKKIAEHMVMSVHTSPHVFSAYEVDFSRVEKLRQAKKAEYEAAGTKLTYTAFIAKATVDTIRQFPFSNASLDGDNIVYKRDINLGIAVALETGLIVPVIRNADERSMLGMCRAIQDLAHRARNKQLKPEEVQGGTFTITNPGIFGAIFGLPIISQPQVAILGVGSVDKRVVVVDDMIAIRPMCYLTLGFDHRLIDGADAGRFLQALKDRLQGFDESWV
ncbi:MAG TPA: dihydrolipoamide acetyltransferase family protein [Vicinamibacterales bacterium]|nr:dihydrolipoamide acetyltransferase family protein [Vicinamibacterales bacterium]